MRVRENIQTSLIIPSYFADQSLIEMTQRCLDSLEYGRPDEVIVVDDGSPREMSAEFTTNFVLNRGSTINLQWTKKNLGYAGAVNWGLERTKGDIIIIANNDIEFVPGWLEAITEPLQNGYDISSICTSDGGHYETEDKITEGDKFGSLWAMRRETYDKLGPLDTSFGNYFEDLDYRRRALDAGLRVAKNHAVVVEHVGKATFSVTDPDDTQYLLAKQRYLAKHGFIE